MRYLIFLIVCKRLLYFLTIMLGTLEEVRNNRIKLMRYAS